MAYYVTDLRLIKNKYFFEVDTLGNMHVYKAGTMEYLDSIYLGINPTKEKFLNEVNNWLLKNK
ncbi:hypothetical protein [Clostridium paraputrificum]|uniref:hypothetical protein n=1 Tax=Clostridium paraputrificum TaxID=29363 RepID=UPI000C0819F3|nr:hypothetical protein [Clostridium paraputrificum]